MLMLCYAGKLVTLCTRLEHTHTSLSARSQGPPCDEPTLRDTQLLKQPR